MILMERRAMEKTEQLLLVDSICDDFESNLKLGAGSEIAAHLESAKRYSEDSGFLDFLLSELIALKIVYSMDRQATADSLRSEYPHQREQIENAIGQRSLLRTVNESTSDTKVGIQVDATDRMGDLFGDDIRSYVGISRSRMGREGEFDARAFSLDGLSLIHI